MFKILEHLIKNRLEWFLENNNRLAETQFGFRKGSSTMDSLSTFVTDIRIALSKRKSVVGVFLDVAAAYDNVLLPVLRQKMLQLNIPERIINFVFNSLTNRAILINSQNSTLPARSVWKGLPQGSVLSPLLYSIYTYDLDLTVKSFCNILQYADDLALYLEVDKIQDASSKLNDAIYYLNNWLSDHGLSLSIPKSSVVCFTRSRSIPDIDISCNGQNFPIKDKVKFLGMILDSKMTGVHHINYTIQKCEKNLNILRALSGVWWGAHPVTQRLLYNSLIRSLLDYGSFLLLPCSKIALKSLEKIQSKCLRIILGAMKSSPINAMQVECVEPPLQFRRQYLSDKFLFKIYQRMSHPLIPKLHLLHQLAPTNEYWSHKDLPCLLISYRKLINLPSPVYQCRLNPLFETPYQALIYEPEVILNLGIENHSLDAQVRLNQIISEKWADWLTIYTDASKLSGESHVGSAVWIPKYNIILNFKCPPVCSIFTGEDIAILEALKFAESHKLNKVVLFSDSKSCLQAIRSNQFKCRFKYQFILKIKTLLLDCHRQGLQFVLVWIPSHTGISGNETADACAKQATVSGSLTHNGIYPNDLASIARTNLLLEWSKDWEKTSKTKGLHYANVQPDIPCVPWFFRTRNFKKRVISTVSQHPHTLNSLPTLFGFSHSPSLYLHNTPLHFKQKNKIYERDKKLQESVDSYNIPSPAFSIDNSEIWGCSTCSTAFENLETYNTHLTACSSQANKDSKATDEVKVKRKFLCDICGKTSHSNASLQIHMSTHENVFPFKCEVCPYQGRTLDLLRVHKRSHMVDKPFKCSQCPKSTTTASNLAKHMRHVHSNTRPYKCTYCDKAFSYQHDMKRHIKDIHLRQGTVECDLCFKKFNTKKILQGHRSKIHNIKGERQGRLPSYLQCQIIDETIENIINDDNST
ncbi:hypothetical protein evm_011173 [Chilo suppressalis]|nr:hypothetical protein evm_011173 [Chilo suppressalis]